MSNVLFGGRSAYAWVWLAVWVGAASLIAIVLTRNPLWLWLPGTWESRDALILVLLLLLIVLAWPMHAIDSHAFGLRFLHSINGTRQSMADAPMNGFLTNLSIRAALTTFLLVWLSRGAADGSLWGEPEEDFLRWSAIAQSPSAFLFVMIAATLGLSLMTTMAALLCTDYSLRFEWPDRANKQPNRVKLELRRKAHRFHVIGFYCLMWSLAAATALVDYFVCLIASTAVFSVMWSYYFFPRRKYSIVPDLVNLPRVSAAGMLKQAGLSGTFRIVPAAAAADQVIGQNAAAGAELNPWAEVQCDVSNGVPPPSAAAP